jgi:DivIVA domain-containing protein
VNQTALQRIEDARFQTTKFGRGYDMRQVDTFLSQLTSALRAGQPVRELCREARFEETRLRAGYAQPAVDDFLDQVAAASVHPHDRR